MGIIEESREFVTSKLKSTRTKGMSNLLKRMEEIGFFTAPCSGGNHYCCEGGLVVHTANVIRLAEKIGKQVLSADEFKEMKNSIILAAALHDLGKAGSWDQPYYTVNLVKSRKKIDGEYPMVPSTSKPYEINKDLPYFDHADLSLKEAGKYIELDPQIYFAIKYHDGPYGSSAYWLKGHEEKLQMIVHMADFWVCCFDESKFLDGMEEEGEE